MFGEQQPPPSLPGMAPPNLLASNQAPEAVLAYYAAAYAQALQQAAPQQHAMPMRAAFTPQQHAMPMFGPAPSMAYMPPPPPALPKKPGTPTSRRAQTADTASLWTNILCLLVGIVIGVACVGRPESSTPQEQQSPQQQLHR